MTADHLLHISGLGRIIISTLISKISLTVISCLYKLSVCCILLSVNELINYSESRFMAFGSHIPVTPTLTHGYQLYGKVCCL